MELYGRGRNNLDSNQSGNKLYKLKGGVEKESCGVDDIQSRDAIKELLDTFHNNLRNYNNNIDNILDYSEDINDPTSIIKDMEPLLAVSIH